VFGDRDSAVIVWLFAQYHLEQCRFARAIASDKSDLLLALHLEVYIIKERLIAEAFGEVG
jgi:hypothetical protein